MNINLKRKPEWYQDVCPSGHVPCIQHDDGRAVYESFIICEYIVRNFFVKTSMIYIGSFNLFLVVRLPATRPPYSHPRIRYQIIDTLRCVEKVDCRGDVSETIM